MTLLVVVALLLAAGLGWWVMHRSARLRREAEAREARMLEALFEARRSGGVEAVNLDGVFGERRAKAAEPADELLRAARLQAEIAATVDSASGARAAASAPAPAEPAATASAAAVALPAARRDELAPARDEPAPARDESAAAGAEESVRDLVQDRASNLPRGATTAGAEVPVRDLVQVFYEARGFRAEPAEASARPIEVVLTHKSDPRRAYAFAPVSGSLSVELMHEIVRHARAIDQLRVLIAVEEPLPPEVAAAVPAQGVRVFDRAAMRAQLAKVEPAVVEKLVAAARRRAARRRAATQ